MSTKNTDQNPRNVIGLPGLNREINASQVMDLIFKHGPISRAELVKQTGIKAKTISSIIDEFDKNGLIKEVGLAKSTGGRPPVLYEIRSSGRYIIGIDVRRDEMIGVLTNLHGTLVASLSKEIKDTSPNTVVPTAITIVNEMCDEAKIPLSKINGVGMAIPGLVDSRKQKAIYSVPLNWEDVPLGTMLSEALNVEVKVVNDAVADIIRTCFQKRTEAPESTLLYFTSFAHSDGEYADFSFALALNGRAYLGQGGMAGETSYYLGNPLRNVETDDQTKHFEDISQLASACSKDKKMADKLWSPLAKELCSEIIRGSNIFDPSEIIISSDLPEFESLVGDSVNEIYNHNSVHGIIKRRMANHETISMPKISFQQRLKTDVATGSALPFIQKLYNPPSMRGEKIL